MSLCIHDIEWVAQNLLIWCVIQFVNANGIAVDRRTLTHARTPSEKPLHLENY